MLILLLLLQGRITKTFLLPAADSNTIRPINRQWTESLLEGCMSGETRIVSVTDYWPEVMEDLSLVIWSHATNSQEKVGSWTP